MDRRLIGAAAGLATVLAVAGVTPASATDQSVDTAHRYSTSIALQTGSGFAWCQSSWGFVNAGVRSTVEVDLTGSMSCDAAALADVRGVYVWFSGGGSVDADYLRAE